MNKDIFISTVLKNKVLYRYIFDRVYEINRIYQDENHHHYYKWNTIIKSPKLMITFGYFNLLKIFYDQRIKDILLISANTELCGRDKQFMEAARVGRLDILKYLIEVFKIIERSKERQYEKEFQRVLMMAIICNQINIVKYLIESVDYQWDYAGAYTESPRSMNVAMVEYLANQLDRHPDQKQKVNSDVFNKAGAYGNTNVIQWLITNRPNGLERGNKMLYFAVINDKLEAVRYLLQLGPLFNSESEDKILYEHAATNNNLEMMKLLHQFNISKESSITTELIWLAGEKNNLEMLKWIVETFDSVPKYPKSLIKSAAKNNNLGMVKWLVENTSIKYPDDIISIAAKSNSLEIIKYLQTKQGVKFSSDNMDAAAKHGDLDLLKWFHENRSEGCTTAAIDKASKKGKLEAIKWLHSNTSARCTSRAMDKAAKNGHMKVVVWLHENRTEGCTPKALTNTFDFQMIKWLLTNRTEVSSASVTISQELFQSKEGLDNIKWLFENGRITSNMIDDVYIGAISSNNMELIGWILCNRTEFREKIDNDLMKQLIDKDQYETIDWILNNHHFKYYKLIKYQSIIEEEYPESHKLLEIFDRLIIRLQSEQPMKRRMTFDNSGEQPNKYVRLPN
ncbi:hypothetical protein PPL_09785 [Heterostelium album PN500]|uniref:Ankyrin repeat protein n=1 Tax=Heterostelium pallidum (strain ATCC 26659 / Pp 5 / PN500) TaxID=670386 RepID=D3BP22_HETP5|nr:hypothetical protein PPL_09785 [Heterostelium album PN500]EFA77032.1 hypothetical protein PPL_09785 [Heterostelium album PN500]|eukprot:XP_020429162.1 hypothetical protein PPL_09785 [Heterostelium album PN500]